MQNKSWICSRCNVSVSPFEKICPDCLPKQQPQDNNDILEALKKAAGDAKKQQSENRNPWNRTIINTPNKIYPMGGQTNPRCLWEDAIPGKAYGMVCPCQKCTTCSMNAGGGICSTGYIAPSDKMK